MKRDNMSVQALLEKLKLHPETVEFAEVIAAITDHYHYTPVRFSNAGAISESGSNEGSCKIFAFAKMQGLSEAETLACFGHYYRHDVLANPHGNDHTNIRNFMLQGWAGIHFDAEPLSPR
jgi:hypothetical protein